MGGLERFIVDLSNELARKGHEVVLVTIKDDAVHSDYRKFYCDEIAANVKYRNLGLPDGLSLKAEKAIYSVIREEMPDVVHMHLTNTPIFALYVMMRLHNKVSFVETIHNSLVPSYNSRARRLYFQNCGRWGWSKFVCLSETNYKDMFTTYPYCSSTMVVNGRAPQTLSPHYDTVRKEMESMSSSADSLMLLIILIVVGKPTF